MIEVERLIEAAKQEAIRMGDDPTWENIAHWLAAYACGLLEDNARLMKSAVQGYARGRMKAD